MLLRRTLGRPDGPAGRDRRQPIFPVTTGLINLTALHDGSPAPWQGL
jgi:hypothetical protein